MPRYDYPCRCGLLFEAIAGFDDDEMICGRCGQPAKRASVYREQYISCETGPKGGLKGEPPRDEKDLRKPFAEFREASQEIDHAYSRVDDPNVKAPNYYKEGIKKARERGAKVRT